MCALSQTARPAILNHVSNVWKVEWNLLGNLLAASAEDSSVQLWRANFAAQWSVVSRIQGVEQDEPQPMDDFQLVNGGL